MQKKIYTIKERIKEIAVNKGIPLGKYFTDLGVSSTGFSGEKLKNAINSDVIQKIIYKYPDVDLQWLITGKESVQAENCNKVAEPASSYGINKFEDLTIDKKLNAIYKELQIVKTNTIANKEEIAKVELASFTKHLEIQQKELEKDWGKENTKQRA